MSLLNKLNYIFSRKQKINLIYLFVYILIGTVLELLGVTAILPFVNIILTPSMIQENKYTHFIYQMFNMRDEKQFVIFVGLVLIVIYIIKNIYILFMYNFQYKFVFNNQRILSCKLLDSYINQPYIYHTKHNTVELIRNVNNDTNMFFSSVLAILQLLTELSVCFVLFLFLLATDIVITVAVALLMGVFMLLFMRVFKERIKVYGLEAREYNVTTSKWLWQSFGGIKEIKILEREDYFKEGYEDSYKKFAENQRKYQLSTILPRPVMEAICISGLLGIVIIKIIMGVDMKEFVPVLSVFAVAAFRMLPSFNRISANLSSLIYNKVAVDSVYQDLYDISKMKNSKAEILRDSIDFENEISISDLSFVYPDTNDYVLEDVNLSIKKNTSVAFIGPSGAGKTTLIDIVLGILKPSNGQILCDGISIYENIKCWHNKIGYISQSIYLMDDSIRKNIAFGVDDSDIDESRLESAIRDSQLKDFIDTLENGIETEIGENGVRLSGGQRQRIGIARALYNNPEILVLDEATSALDTDTENAVLEAIDKISKNRTLIIIAHRLTTIEKCDIVYEVKDKKVSIAENFNSKKGK